MSEEMGEFEKRIVDHFESYTGGYVDKVECKSIAEDADDRIASQQREIDELKSAIRETLIENANLADGDNCTLIKLKNVLR